MAGLRRICRLYGGMVIQGVKWSWDYAAEEPIRESEMPLGSDRWKASEAAKRRLIAAEAASTRPAQTADDEPGMNHE